MITNKRINRAWAWWKCLCASINIFVHGISCLVTIIVLAPVLVLAGFFGLNTISMINGFVRGAKDNMETKVAWAEKVESEYKKLVCT